MICTVSFLFIIYIYYYAVCLNIFFLITGMYFLPRFIFFDLYDFQTAIHYRNLVLIFLVIKSPLRNVFMYFCIFTIIRIQNNAISYMLCYKFYANMNYIFFLLIRFSEQYLIFINVFFVNKYL